MSDTSNSLFCCSRSCAQPRLTTTPFYVISLSGLPHNDYHSLVIIIYILVPLARVSVVKEVTSFRGLGQLMGVARNRTGARAAAGRKK